jgi:hypothetical protein
MTAALLRGLQVEVKPQKKASAHVFDVTVWARNTPHRFTAGWAGQGWPADVERLYYLAPEIDVVVAANLSKGARTWLTDQGLGFVDEHGNAEIIRRSGLVISREPLRVTIRRETSDRWNRSTLTAAEAALSGVAPTVESIERATGMSRQSTAAALSRLERLGHLERPTAQRGPTSGRNIADMSTFLDAYAAAAGELRSKQPVVLVHRLWKDPLETLHSEIASMLNKEKTRWAVTGVAASVMLAPYLSDVTTLELYVDAESMSNSLELATLLGGRIVDKGHRIEIRELPTTMSSRGPVIDGVQIALPVRVYADLVASGGRFADAAEHLRESLDV